MKNPLHYQLSEYDCGPTSMLNAISFLFQRDEIPPEIVRNIMLYCLDCFGADGGSGKSGTSCTAMMFLSNWLNGFGQAGHLPISSRHLFEEPEIEMVTDHPKEYNRIVPAWMLERKTREIYAMGPKETREAVLLFNEITKLTEDMTIEYMI